MSATTHLAPTMALGRTRCCDTPVLKLPRGDKITTSERLVTCGKSEHASESELIAEITRLEAQRDAAVGALEEIHGHLMTASVFQGMPGVPVVEGVRQMVNDHEELEARIEAVLTLPAFDHDPHQIDSDGGEMVLDRDQVHHLLRGGKRIPDDISEIEQ